MPAQLITIAHSHYCEAARWLLLAAGVSFREDAYCFVYDAEGKMSAGWRVSKQLREKAADGNGDGDGDARRRFAAGVPQLAVGSFEGYPPEKVAARYSGMVPAAEGEGGELLGRPHERRRHL